MRGGEEDCGYVLADCWDGFEVWVGGAEGGFYLFEEGCFAGVVEAEEEDGVFWGVGSVVLRRGQDWDGLRWRMRERNSGIPSLLVA